MENKTIEQLFKKAFGDMVVFLLERSWRSVLAWIFIIIIAPPLLDYIHLSLKMIPYVSISKNTFLFFSHNFNYKDLAFTIFYIILAILVLRSDAKQRLLNEIDENFQNLRKWNIPLNSHLQIEKTDDRSSKSLGIYSSVIPSLLKPTYNWYDYTLSLSIKFGNEFWIVIRAANNLNGVAFKFSLTEITPYLIYEGSYIKDDTKIESLPVVFKSRQWIENLNIKVEGSVVDFHTQDINFQYKIPTRSLNIYENDLLLGIKDLSELEESNRKIKQKFDNWYALYQEAASITDPITKSEKRKESDNAWDELNKDKNKLITLDFQMGSIGFKNESDQMALINSLKIKRI